MTPQNFYVLCRKCRTVYMSIQDARSGPISLRFNTPVKPCHALEDIEVHTRRMDGHAKAWYVIADLMGLDSWFSERVDEAVQHALGGYVCGFDIPSRM